MIKTKIARIIAAGILLSVCTLLFSHSTRAATFDVTSYSIPSGENNAQYIASSADGNVWFVERVNNKLSKIDAMTGAVTEYSVPGIGADCGGITSGPDGNLWYIKGDTNKIGRWDLATNTEATFDVPSGSCYFGIITGPDNNLWFTREDGKVGKMTTGGVTTLYDVPDGGSAMQLVIGPDNNIWFPAVDGSKLVKLQTDGTMTSVSLPGGLSGTYGIAKDGTGNLWVSSAFSNKVIKYEIGSSQFTAYDTPAQSTPFFLSTGGDGNVWFGSMGGQGFGRVENNGNVTMYGLPNGQANAPIFNLATASFGNIWGITDGKAVNAVSMVYKLELPNSQLKVLGSNNNCSQVQLASGNTTGISDFKKMTLAELPSDGSRTYPVGLADFKINVPIGSTQRVNIVFQNCSAPNNLIVRKYSPRTGRYSTIKDAQITQITLNDKPAVLASYNVTDGGELDDDGIANGVIVDPVGLATPGSDVSAAAPNTGLPPASIASMPALVVLLLGGTTLGTAIVITRRRGGRWRSLMLGR